MTSTQQDRWSRVKGRLRAEIGEDVFSSWFARMDLEGLQEGTVRLSVPTRFLKSWIQSHYAETLLACWQAEENEVNRIEVTVRSAVLQIGDQAEGESPTSTAIACASTARTATPMPATAGAHEALGGSPLDPRLDLRHLRGGPLQHPGARGGQAGRGRQAQRSGDVQPALHPCRGRPGQNPPPASASPGPATRIGERKVLYLTAEKFMYGFVQSLRAQNTLAFKEALRGIGVLVIDDLQFLQGKIDPGRVLPHPQRPDRCRAARW